MIECIRTIFTCNDRFDEVRAHMTEKRLVGAFSSFLLSTSCVTEAELEAEMAANPPGKVNAQTHEAWQLCHVSCVAPDWHELCPDEPWCQDARAFCLFSCDKEAAEIKARRPSQFCEKGCSAYLYACNVSQDDHGVESDDCKASAGICLQTCAAGFSQPYGDARRRMFLHQYQKWEVIQE